MRVSVLAGCALLVAASPAFSATIHVAPDSSGDFPNIQAAIDAASSGDEIVLLDGSFTGDGNWDLDFGTKDLVLRSLNGYENTTLEGGDPYWCRAFGQHRVLTLDGGQTSATRIEGVTIQDFAPGPEGGTVRCLGSSPVICRVRIGMSVDKDTERGLDVLVQGGAPVIEDCVFQQTCKEHPISDVHGLAIYSRDAWLTVDRCSFGGFDLLNAAVDLDGGTFTDCDFHRIGGYKNPSGTSVLASQGTVSFTRCSFQYAFGWCIEAYALAELIVDNCDFEYNTAVACISASGNATIRNTTFRDGFVHDGLGVVYGGGPNAVVALDRCVFLNNTTGWPGGASAVRVGGGSLQVTHCTFGGNRNVSPGYRGSVFIIGQGSDVSIDHTIIAFGGQRGLPDGAVACGGPPARLDISCSDFFGNEGGDWTGCVAGMDGTNGNISADPLFCSYPTGDLGLRNDSPCAPPQSGECELIGALGATCGTVSVQERSWGSIKALYR